MKKRNRRIAAFALSLALVFSLLPVLPVLASDDYPYQSMTYGRYSAEDLDPWRFYYRECTSFVAWRLNNDNGIEFDNFYGGIQWGNAREWRAAADALGIRVDNVPAVGAIYWQDAYFHCSASGHVAWVKALAGPDHIVIEHYAQGSYKEVTVPVDYASAFIHIRDLDGEDALPQPEKPAEEPTPEPAPEPAQEPPEQGIEIHFPKMERSAAFQDVAGDAWYASAVADAFSFGLMQGDSAAFFRPEGEVTVIEAVVLAARIHQIYSGGEELLPAGEGDWYLPYLEYVRANGIADKDILGLDLTRPATRAEFARILAASLPEEALPPINEVPDGAIPDVDAAEVYSDAVYLLYRAGILAGDSNGSFLPNDKISRAETAAIVSRMADSASRIVI